MTTKILEKILSNSKQNKSIIGVRKYSDGEDIYIGYIVDYNETLIVLQHITKYGLEDGLIVEMIENIESFETGGEYTSAYQHLLTNHKEIKEQTVKTLKLEEGQNWQYHLLTSMFDIIKIITVELNNNTFTHGFIVDFDETYVHLNQIDHVGKDEGTIIYKINDIVSLTIDRLESRKRLALYKWRKKKPGTKS